MIELPEALTLKKQLSENIINKTVFKVLPPTKSHKFCWFNGDPIDYDEKIKSQKITNIDAFGIFVEIEFQNGLKLSFNDGVNIRYNDNSAIPDDYQLLIVFTDKTMLIFTVAMYGGIILHDESYENEYYQKSRDYISPFSNDFKKVYEDTLRQCKPTLSAKAFLATEQRFPGIGNGVLQDILFEAGIHPKRKISTLNKEEQDKLFVSIITVLNKMVELGGRDTEKDLFGNTGKYITKMSKNTISNGCPVCHSLITKEAYLGGSVYYCSHCQPLIK